MSDQKHNDLFTWYQQGDVLIQPIGKIPAEAVKKSGRVLAEGEATGHSHQALAPGVLLFTFNRTLYMRVPPGGTSVVHEEHKPVQIPAGDYTIGIVREYDHFSETTRFVYD